jgi:hypothetical protein
MNLRDYAVAAPKRYRPGRTTDAKPYGASVFRPETRYLSSEAARISRKGILTYADPTLQTYAGVKLATYKEPLHHIRYHPSQRENRDYLVAHECVRIMRELGVPPEQGRIAVVAKPGYHAAADIRRSKRGDNPISAQYAAYTLYSDILGALTSGPADVHIDRWLHNNYPGLRPQQERALRQEVDSAYRSLAQRAEFAPKNLVRISATLTYALAEDAGDLIGAPGLAQPFRDFADRYQARDLRRMLADVGDQGHAGDVATTNRWARYLGVEDWFEWTRWEQRRRE